MLANFCVVKSLSTNPSSTSRFLLYLTTATKVGAIPSISFILQPNHKKPIHFVTMWPHFHPPFWRNKCRGNPVLTELREARLPSWFPRGCPPVGAIPSSRSSVRHGCPPVGAIPRGCPLWGVTTGAWGITTVIGAAWGVPILFKAAAISLAVA